MNRGRATGLGRVLVDVVMLSGIAMAGLLLALQGWRNVGPAIDMVAYFRGAEELLRHGILPVHGDVSSYGSFSPPGAAWLLAPGMLLFDDPRLFEKLGSAALHVATLIGIFLLAREAFGRPTAYLAVALYGLSGLALAFAGSLWPIGHPAFTVWVTWLAVLWVAKRDARFLTAALLVLGIGLFDTLRIAPLAMILPALWLIYRPPVAPRWLAVAGLVVAFIWLPYFGLQLDRGFADLRSQLTLQNIVPTNYREAWCDASLNIRTIEPQSAGAAGGGLRAGPPLGTPPPVEATQPSLLERLLGRVRAAVEGVLAPFLESASWAPFAWVLAALTLIALAASALTLRPVQRITDRLRGRSRRGVLEAASADPAVRRMAVSREALLLATLLPWLILLAVAEPGLPVRFFWLWSLLAIWLAAFFTEVLAPRLRIGLGAAVGVLVVGSLLVNPLVGHLGSWLQDGWEGADPAEVVVVDAVASRLHAQGRTSAAIGYRPLIYAFMASYNIIDPDYRVGTEFDLLFQYRAGITNLNRCPEGISAVDEYRVVQIEPLPGPDAPRDYFDVPVVQGFHTLAVFYRYHLLQRD